MARAKNVQPGMAGAFAQAATGEDGTFTLAGLGDGPFTVTVGGGASDVVPIDHPEAVAVGATGLTLTAARGLAVSGRLVDAAGNPVIKAYVMAHQQGATTNCWGRTDESGAFSIGGLREGKVRLTTHRERKQVDLGEHRVPDAGIEVRIPD